MVEQIERSPQAKRDALEIVTYLVHEASEEIAMRFLAALERSLSSIKSQPGMGSPRWRWAHPKLAGIRHWPVTGFPNYLVFYRSTEIGIFVVRILHGSRDLLNTLARED